MRERKPDLEERLTFRSTLASIIVAVVDHRLLFQVAVALLAVFALRAWGPEEISRGIDYVAGSESVRQVGRGIAEVWHLTIGGLQAVDRTAERAGVAPISDASVPSSIQLPASIGSAGTRGEPFNPGVRLPSSRPDAAPGSPRVAVSSSESSSAGRVDAVPVSNDTSATVLWIVVKDQETIRAEVHDTGADGVDLLLFRDGQVWRRERWADAARARAEAELKRADLEKLGWMRKLPETRPALPH